jgi:uncharacterized repeat protein (TIGR01451 family)
MPHDRQASKRRPGKKVLGALGAFFAFCGFFGIQAFDDTILFGRSSSGPDASRGSAPEAPPNVPVEIRARKGNTVFGDDVPVALGEAFQVVVLVRNIGQLDASGVIFRVVLPGGTTYRSGSCRMRSGGDEELRRCSDNVVNGGFAYDQIAQSGWVQVYFAAELSKLRVNLNRPRTLRVIVNSNETSELADSVRIHPSVG